MERYAAQTMRAHGGNVRTIANFQSLIRENIILGDDHDLNEQFIPKLMDVWHSRTPI